MLCVYDTGYNPGKVMLAEVNNFVLSSHYLDCPRAKFKGLCACVCACVPACMCVVSIVCCLTHHLSRLLDCVAVTRCASCCCTHNTNDHPTHALRRSLPQLGVSQLSRHVTRFFSCCQTTTSQQDIPMFCWELLLFGHESSHLNYSCAIVEVVS